MAVIVLGCGVAGLSVLAYALHSIHPHPSRTSSSCRQFPLYHDFGCLASHAQALGDFSLTQTFSRAPRVAEHHRLQLRVLFVAIHPHALPIWLLIALTHRNFPGFYPRDFICNSCPLFCCAFSRRGIPSRFCLHGLDFAGFTHAVFPWADL